MTEEEGVAIQLPHGPPGSWGPAAAGGRTTSSQLIRQIHLLGRIPPCAVARSMHAHAMGSVENPGALNRPSQSQRAGPRLLTDDNVAGAPAALERRLERRDQVPVGPPARRCWPPQRQLDVGCECRYLATLSLHTSGSLGVLLFHVADRLFLIAHCRTETGRFTALLTPSRATHPRFVSFCVLLPTLEPTLPYPCPSCKLPFSGQPQPFLLSHRVIRLSVLLQPRTAPTWPAREILTASISRSQAHFF